MFPLRWGAARWSGSSGSWGRGGRRWRERSLVWIRSIMARYLVEGQAVRFRSAAEAVAAGLGLVPEDRKLQGLILEA